MNQPAPHSASVPALLRWTRNTLCHWHQVNRAGFHPTAATSWLWALGKSLPLPESCILICKMSLSTPYFIRGLGRSQEISQVKGSAWGGYSINVDFPSLSTTWNTSAR